MPQTRDLLLEVAVLEEEIVSLEKRVIHLGREIEIEVLPTTDKETIWQIPSQNIPPEKVEILDSPSISPKDSARINSKPLLSLRKSIDQKSKLSKPSLPAGKVTENKSRSIKTVSIPSRNSVDTGGFMKPSISPKDFPEPRRTSTLVPPQQSQFQRSSSLPKAPLRNTTDLKSRRLSLPKKGPQETLSPTHTVAFVPMKISAPREDEESTPPLSPAPVSPSDVGKSCSQPPRIKTGNGRPPMTKNARFGRKDLLSNKVAPMARIGKTPSTPRRPDQEKGLQHTSRLPRQPLTHDTMSTRRAMKSSTAAFEQRMNVQRSSVAPNPSTPFNCDSSLQELVDVINKIGEDDINNEDVPATSEVDGDYKLTHLSPDIAKVLLLSKYLGSCIPMFLKKDHFRSSILIVK
jgi:hypothetical protein